MVDDDLVRERRQRRQVRVRRARARRRALTELALLHPEEYHSLLDQQLRRAGFGGEVEGQTSMMDR